MTRVHNRINIFSFTYLTGIRNRIKFFDCNYKYDDQKHKSNDSSNPRKHDEPSTCPLAIWYEHDSGHNSNDESAYESARSAYIDQVKLLDYDIPKCAKLSRPGNRPRANEISVVTANFDSSLQGLTVSRQFNRISTNMKPISPNKAPEHPMEAIKLCESLH